MRLWMSAAVASLFASGQALAQAAPIGSELVLVQPKGTACLDTRDNTRIPLRLTNRSTERIAFHLSAPGQERNWLHTRSSTSSSFRHDLTRFSAETWMNTPAQSVRFALNPVIRWTSL